MKKYLSIILAIFLIFGALTGCAEQNISLKQNDSYAYAKLMTYKTENYSQQNIADFRNTFTSLQLF